MRAFLVVSLVAGLCSADALATAGEPVAASPNGPAPSGSAWQYDCDGTDEFLLAEIDEAFRSGIGFGETWDATVCEEGLLSVYAEGVTSRWPAYRKKPKPVDAVVPVVTRPMPSAQAVMAKRMEDQFFALAMPIFGAVAFAFAAAIAALIGVFLRLRKQFVVDVICPNQGCKTALPFIIGDAPQIFCPRCGGACRVDVHGVGKLATATAVPL